MIPTLLFRSKVLLVSFPWRNRGNPATRLSVCFGSSTPIAQPIAVAKEVDPFTVSYLINSCGFSPESATLVSKLFQLKNPSNADSVIDLFKKYGFSDADIKKVITWYPRVLLLKAERNIKFKMEFFLSNGVKDYDLVKIISGNPVILGASLSKKIIPCYDFFKRVLVHDELVVKSLKRSSWISRINMERDVSPNFELLKKVGVPESNIQFFFIHHIGAFGLDNAKFSKRVNRVVSMGFDPSKYSFVEAIRCWPTKSTWERKAPVFRSWGWSDSDILLAFKKNPGIMSNSVEKFTAVMEFLVNKMGCDPSDVAAAPHLFNQSLKKSIIPKCSVTRVLKLKGLIGDEISLNTFMVYSKRRFLNEFVYCYLQQVPELLDIFEGEVDISELGYGFEGKSDTKLKYLCTPGVQLNAKASKICLPFW